MGGDWYFKDPQGDVQGPFSSEEMRAWYEVGYLAPELPVARGDPRSNPFVALAAHFPNGSNAFLDESAAEDEGGCWYFLDSAHKQQGPFTDIHMRQWHMAGYFEPTLMIIDMNSPNPKWEHLRVFFPNVADAFAVASRQQGGRTGGGSMMQSRSPQEGMASSQVSRGAGSASEDPRFRFPEWMPVPPRYRGVKKVYPSEKNGGKRQVAIRDVHGQQVKEFGHLR